MKAMTAQQASRTGFLYEQAANICLTNDDMTYNKLKDRFEVHDGDTLIMKLPAKYVKMPSGKVKVYDFTELFESVQNLNQ
ncbi:MAG: hypothetical protein ACYTEQ_30805 [Planctomycetota bacterium]|jgi:hypothetical protein